MVPDATPMSYYGQPILKPPTWKWPIAAYLFTGGLAAGTSMVGAAARLRGDRRLAGAASAATMSAIGVSAGFLIEDLGRRSRFHHMLRVVKITSPMSVGTWIFSVFSSLAGASAAAEIGEKVGVPARLARPVTAVGQVGSALVGPALATYTAVLLADTAVPAWHEARRHLPWVFAGSATASGGAMGILLSTLAPFDPSGGFASGPRRMAVVGAALEVGADEAMHRRLRTVSTGDTEKPDIGSAYASGPPRVLAGAARAASVTGAAGVALAGRQDRPRTRLLAGAGALLVLAGAALERFAIFHAGKTSTTDPVYTVGPQRLRLVPPARRP